MTAAARPAGSVIVVGAGIAGAAAAIAAARLGAAVTVIDAGAGASSLATGAIDAAWSRADRAEARTPDLSPASRDVFEALGIYALPPRPARLVTTAGVVREARGHDAALLDMASIDARTAGKRIAVVRCSRPGWDADVLASAWGAAWVAIDARVLKYADERGLPDADFAARHDDEGRLAWLAERLREALASRADSGLAGIVLPPSLGVDRPRSHALSERVGVPCGEPIALPGGPAGLRFENARDRAFAAAGIARVRERVSHAGAASGRWQVTTDEGTVHEARAVVLATGGLLGGGLEYAPPEVGAPARPPVRAGIDAPLVLGAHGRPLEAAGSQFGAEPERLAWPFVTDGPLERAGVLVDQDGACVDAPRGLFAAGEVLADAPRTWLHALTSGALAGAYAARRSG
ncbi:MAG TPA: FAD-dependent oxidoreductase [Polyangiaceae bacterium]|nr:FAD-dependent oxidoreductase [Polyangiaceae bacterium]